MKDDVINKKMSKYLFTNAVAKRAKSIQAGARPLLDHGSKLNHPLDIALEEMKRGLVRIDVAIKNPLSLLPETDKNTAKTPLAESVKKKKVCLNE